MSKSDKLTLAIFILGAIIITAVVVRFTMPNSSYPVAKPFTRTAPSTPEPPATTLFFAGDIMLSRNVAAKMSEASDFTLPFQKVADVTKNADIAFANLESPFNDVGNHSIEGSLVFNADPKAVQGLKFAGFDVLSTANNHALDQGQKGLNLTLQTLEDNFIYPVGTRPQNVTENCHKGQTVQRNGIVFGFLAYSYTALNDGGKTTDATVCDSNDLTKLKQDILAMKGHTADVIIVNMHAGIEYTRKPTQAQIDFAHAAIDAGADLVVGEHPHWIQTIEQYNGKWIVYSMGNFVFDQMWSEETREGLTLLATFKEHELSKIELKPVIVDDFCCPRWATADETKSILNKIDLTSSILVPHN